MTKKLVLVIVLILAAIAIYALAYISSGVQRTFKSQVMKGLERTSLSEKDILTEQDIIKLPETVQKYLTYAGVIGKEKVRNIRMVSTTVANLGADKGWVKMETAEYNFYDNQPGRSAMMKFKMKGFIPVVGLDCYVNQKGHMLMKPLGLLTVVDEKGHAMDDTSAEVMMFLSMCANAPATLIDDRIQWTTVDSSTVNAEFNDNGCKVSAILKFNEIGQLVDFSTEDKFYNPTGDSYRKVRWSTPILDYKNINGLNLSTYGEATWHFPEGDFIYGKNTLKELEYNCTNH